MANAARGHRKSDARSLRLATFGKRLRIARDKVGWSSIDLALALPVKLSGASIRAYENGTTEPSPMIVRIIEATIIAEQHRSAEPIIGPLAAGELQAILEEAPVIPRPPASESSTWELKREVAAIRQRMADIEAELRQRGERPPS